jgi:hypothetical protein
MNALRELLQKRAGMICVYCEYRGGDEENNPDQPG